MPKKPSDKKPNPDDISIDEYIEMAAEQLADLLWRQWLYMKEEEKKKTKKQKS